MKGRVYLYVGIALLIGLLGGFLFFKSNTQKWDSNLGNLNYGNNQNSQPNRGNCLADDCLLVDNLEYPAGELTSETKDALNEAINDEYKAFSTYEAVIKKFGTVRPFSMIKGAEEQHIASLKAIYDKYGLTVPSNSWINKITVPATLKEACQIGVEAEIANAKLYKDKLIPIVKGYEDITAIFINLMNASEQKHLAAFEKCN
jgi:hypothetical protein